jgi:hypothetical protein
MMVSSFTVTTVTTVTKKRDIPSLRVTQCCASSHAIYLCNSAGGYRPKTGYSGYSGYGGALERVLETLGTEGASV